MICKICNQSKEEGEMSNSHLTPKSLTNRSKHMEINKEGRARGARGSGMPLDKKIICRECERNYFQKLDSKFSDFLRDVKKSKIGARFPEDNPSPDSYRIKFKVDYNWLDTFSASLLYRHSLSAEQKLNLGKYEKTAKEMIERYNRGDSVIEGQSIFNTVCFINTARKISKNVISCDIAFYKQCKMTRIYRFLASEGIEFHIKVSNQKSQILSPLRADDLIVALSLMDDFISKMESLILGSIKN